MSTVDFYSFVNPPDWMASALCAQTDPEMFFPEPGRHSTSKAAKAICDRCPVKAECRQYAADTREPYGIWGGTSERQRRNGRRRQCQGCGTQLPRNANSRIKWCRNCAHQHKTRTPA